MKTVQNVELPEFTIHEGFPDYLILVCAKSLLGTYDMGFAFVIPTNRHDEAYALRHHVNDYYPNLLINLYCVDGLQGWGFFPMAKFPQGDLQSIEDAGGIEGLSGVGSF